MNKWKVMLSAVVIAAALAGCGAGEDQEQTEEQAQVQENQAAGTQQQNGGGNPQMGPKADLIGKVKSIDGQTITVYKSAMMNRPQGDRTGEMPADGEPPQTPAGDGTAPEGGGRMNMEDMFTDETVEIQVTESTKIVSMTFENEQMVEKEITLADLKTDDILSVMLKDDTQEAETITYRTGDFGGGGGGRQPQQQQEHSTTTQ